MFVMKEMMFVFSK